MHHHWQVVPVPLGKLQVVEETFRAEAKADTLGEFQRKKPDEEGDDYFRVWIDGKVKGEKNDEEGLVLGFRRDQYFDLQFGRSLSQLLLQLSDIWGCCVCLSSTD